MRISPVQALYRLALRLLPPGMRRKHGRAMEELFLRQLEDARRRGGVAPVWVVLGNLWDIISRSLYERARPRRPAPWDPRSPRAPREQTMNALLYDVRFALRALRRSPRFTVLAVLTLALGIGVNAALFSVVHGVMLRPLPFPEQDRLVHLAWDRGGSVPRITVPAYKYEFWGERTRAFEAMTTWWASTVRLGEEGEGAPAGALRVPHTFLDVVGWEPALGRGFTAEDDRPGAPAVALLGHDVWRTRYGGDPGVIGRTVSVGGEPHTVVGVLPADFSFPQEPDRDDILLPLRLEADPLDEGENYPILARLAPGVGIDAAEADLDRVYAAFAAEHPELMSGTDRAMVVSSFQELYVGGVGDVLWALMGATALVLLIACANVAALLLARGSARRGEIAVRAALGAGRARIVRHILSESLVLAAGASALGLALAHVGVDVLLGLYPGTLPRGEWIGVNGSVVAYAVAAALVTGVVFGLVAAWPVLRGGPGSALREGAPRDTGRGGLRKAVLAAEAAVSLVLLVGAGLLVATLAEIRSVDPGFTVEGLLTAPLPEPPGGWESEGGMRQVEERTLDALGAVPGVTAAAAASSLPLQRGLNIPVGIQGRPEDFEGAVEWRSVTPGYLDAMEISLVRGRFFTASDEAGAPPVAVVNRAFVERWFPDGGAIGQRIEIGRYRDRYIMPELDVGGAEIVGVVGDVREIDLTVDPRRTVLVPAAQAPEAFARTPVLLVRGRGAGVRRGVREALAGIAGGSGAPDVRSMEQVVGSSLAAERFNALLMGIFALVALLLTAFGIYGVVSYGVRQRRREIGIRMALGARRSEVTRLVMGQGMAPVLVGLAIGVAAAVGLTRFIESLLWGVEPTDPVTIAAVAAILAGVAAVSSWLPVREASGVDPNRSLRPE